jgi:hypothetical protein
MSKAPHERRLSAIGKCRSTVCVCPQLESAFAARLKAKGKPFKVIMVACIRKLFTLLNAMLKTGQMWDPRTAQTNLWGLDFGHSHCPRLGDTLLVRLMNTIADAGKA